jgi:NADPH-dependent 2,4-dienoyl-CoA reductase/sulfur reductase-like enzyme/rhodanese-related sulfurtransferase
MLNFKRILIVGGVAGGASCAARARRLSEQAEIIIFERGPHVSFANCGLPYHVGDVIKKEESLLVATPEVFKQRFNVQVRMQSEVVAIDREAGEIEVKDLSTGESYREKYDALVLSPGAAPIRPPLRGIDLDGIFTVRNIPDTRKMREWIEQHEVKKAVVVGGGFIGLEMTENLVHRGIEVTIVEMLPQVMPLYDPEMISVVHKHLGKKGVKLRLGQTVTGFEQQNGSLAVSLNSGEIEPADIVILSIGVRPEAKLAKDAGLQIGEFGGIKVDDRMRTSDPRIWAVGDAVEVKDFITGRSTLVPLAGPANRQGRIAADCIFGRDSRFRGVQGTSAVVAFGLTIASTGPSEKTLKRLGLWNDRSYEKVYLHPGHHAAYYPGASIISLKLIFSKDDGRIMSAQAAGMEGVEKRIDVLSMAIQAKMTVFDLEEAELCYCPQHGSAKDPVNMAGMIAANVIRGDAQIVHCSDAFSNNAFFIDVREPAEFKRGHVDGAINIPLGELRAKLNELPKEQKIIAYCLVGQRSYFATRMLTQLGYDARNISGGYRTYTSCASPGK